MYTNNWSIICHNYNYYIVNMHVQVFISSTGSGKTTFLDLLTGRRKYGNISVRNMWSEIGRFQIYLYILKAIQLILLVSVDLIKDMQIIASTLNEFNLPIRFLWILLSYLWLTTYNHQSAASQTLYLAVSRISNISLVFTLWFPADLSIRQKILMFANLESLKALFKQALKNFKASKP